MIGTIGSLVQVTSNRPRWLLSASLYTLASFASATSLGAALGTIGWLVHHILGVWALSTDEGGFIRALIGILAVSYAASDFGLIRLPRPILMYAVPVKWWRLWMPYRGAIAYGAALGLGVTTAIPYGAFYVLCVWCALQGDTIYAGLLMGTYGAARALVIFPLSLAAPHPRNMAAWLAQPLFDVRRAVEIVAATSLLFAAGAITSAVLAGWPLEM